MPSALYAAAMLGAVAAPATAQITSPFQGAMPDTIILDGGWQMTPGEELCTLTHHASGAGQDLVVLATPRSEGVVLGLILPARGAYTAPVQLTVMAQATEAKQIGRVTFNPTTGALGTLLMANWPADRLLPRLTSSTRLNFYAPDQRLLRSVRLAGSVAAVEALNRCRRTSSTDKATADAPPEHHVIDVGWVHEFDSSACIIKRMTAKGNELDLFYSRRDGRLLVYRTLTGPRLPPGSHVTAQLSLWRLAPNSLVVADQDNLPPLQLTVAGTAQTPLLVGPTPPTFVDKLRDERRWNTVAFGTANSGPVDIDDTVHTSGSAAALAD